MQDSFLSVVPIVEAFVPNVEAVVSIVVAVFPIVEADVPIVKVVVFLSVVVCIGAGVVVAKTIHREYYSVHFCSYIDIFF